MKLEPRHILYSLMAFTIGYGLSMLFTENGLHAFLAGLLGNTLGFIAIHYIRQR